MKKEINIEIKDLTIGYSLRGRKQKIVKQNISQQLYAGEVTCLLGRNGAGKSTLLRTLSRFQQPLSGEIILRGKNLSLYSEQECALNIGVILTDRTYAGGITVFELVALGRHPHTGFFGKLKKQDKDIIFESMEKAGIVYKSNSYIAELSDGERQKAMIAKVLAQECPVILLDEPTAFLDVNSRIETMALLRELARKENKSILISTHDMESAIRMGDRFWLMDKEIPFVSGIPEDLILSGAFEKLFNHGKIFFNRNTGILDTEIISGKPIFISGDAVVTYWVMNALKKKGFSPVWETQSYPLIICNENPIHFILQKTTDEFSQLNNIEELLQSLN